MNDQNFSIPEIKEDSPLEFSDMVLRTMERDIESIKKSGGATNEVYKSAIPIHIVPKKQKEEIIKKFNTEKQFPIIKSNQGLEQKEKIEQIESLSEKQSFKLNLIMKIILYTATLIIFFLIGYFILPKILPSKIVQQIKPEINSSEQNNQLFQESNNIHSNSTSSNQTSIQAQTQTDKISQSNNLISIFKISSNNILEFNVDPQIPNFNKYYNFLITDALSKATSTNQLSNIFIVNLKDKNNNFLKWTDFLSSLNINLLDQNFWDSNFNSNFVGFIYKNKNGLWPGYVLEIKQNMSPLLIQVGLKKIYDNKNYLSNFYFNQVDFSKSELQNSLIFNKEPITIFKNQTGEKFVYGIFFNKYLIFSTSIEGLEQIMKLII